ncbi:MAG TPA: lamin tail domain-containing protein, partial [Myxococcales bacterium]|nr:lamin tail domain-containing protein [Myxococcales bacterium]
SFNVTGLQRQTTYCFALRVQDEVGNASISNTFTGTTPDTAGPDTAELATGAFTKTSMHVTWTAVGDDGATGTASSYVLRYLSGAACPIDGGNFGSGTVVATGTPQPAGAPEDVLVTGLTPGTTYCFALQVSDDASNTSLSGSASGTTLADTAAPGPVSDLAIGTTTASSLQLTWTAVADDGTDPTSGPVSSHELRSLSGAACPINAGNFATGAAVPLGAPGAPGVAESATASGLAPGVSYCFMVRVTDGAGSATFSNAATATTVDNRPPAPVTNLVALGPDAMGTVGLSWTATGAHAGTGTATAYDLRYEVGGDCATFDFVTAIPVGGLSPPQPAGTPETFTLNGLNIFEQYCFGLQVTNETPNSSLSNIALAWAGASAQIAQIRSIMHGATSSPIALDAAVQGAIVTYLKATVNGRPPGIPDGPGFFIQGSGTGPALFFAMEPQVTLPGMAVSDVVDLHLTQGAWTCPAPPCNGDNGMYIITQATATPGSTGITLPASQDLTNVTLTLPIAAGPWEYEHERVSATGTISTIFTAGAGFSRANFTTPGTASPNQEFRFTDAVMVSKGLISGCTVTVNGTPMWRFGGFAQFSAWAPGDVTPSGCPPISITTTIPLDLESGVSSTTPIAAAFNQPMAPATMTGQTTAGKCSGTFQVSADEFATCVPFTSATGNMGLNNLSADFTLAQTLNGTGAYKLRITTGAASANGNTLAPAYTQPAGFTVTGGTCTSVAPVVISQIYGAGGNAGPPPAIWTHDFVELHNRGTLPVSLSGWSLQYNSATGTNAWIVSPLPAAATIAPGGFFLVQMSGGANGAPLPTPDATGLLSLSGTTGRVALLSTTTPIPANTSCPPLGQVVDFIGYGATPACAEGTPVPALST